MQYFMDRELLTGLIYMNDPHLNSHLINALCFLKNVCANLQTFWQIYHEFVHSVFGNPVYSPKTHLPTEAKISPSAHG